MHHHVGDAGAAVPRFLSVLGGKGEYDGEVGDKEEDDDRGHRHGGDAMGILPCRGWGTGLFHGSGVLPFLNIRIRSL